MALSFPPGFRLCGTPFGYRLLFLNPELREIPTFNEQNLPAKKNTGQSGFPLRTPKKNASPATQPGRCFPSFKACTKAWHIPVIPSDGSNEAEKIWSSARKKWWIMVVYYRIFPQLCEKPFRTLLQLPFQEPVNCRYLQCEAPVR